MDAINLIYIRKKKVEEEGCAGWEESMEKTFNTELYRDTMKGAIRRRLTVRKLFNLWDNKRKKNEWFR